MSRGVPLGLTHGEVQLAGSHPGWLREAERLVDALRAALGHDAVAVEHVGSTAVPGLAAKPIIDVAVGLARDAETNRVIERIEALGYEYQGDAAEEGGLTFFLEDRRARRIAHAHGVHHGGKQWSHYLTVRDRLRTDAEARAAYADLKRGLAERFPHDRPSYTAAKASFITELLGDSDQA